jgi:hypothetical protein
MKKADVEAIGTILDEAFNAIFIDGNKAMTEEDPVLKKDVVMLIHLDRLHKAQPGGLVYRGIEEERLIGIINATRAASKATTPKIDIRVLPLKSRPVPGRVEFFDTRPTIEDCRNPSTHFYIIGGQYTVEAHRILMHEKPANWTLQELSHFSVIPVWTKLDRAGKMTLLQYSRALN